MGDEFVESDAVGGAHRLISLFGYWPSFHDAAIDRCLIERIGPAVTIWFRLNELVEGEEDVKAEAVLRWNEVQELELRGIDVDENNWIWGLTITGAGENLLTEIRQMDGTGGTIRSGSVEVLEATRLP